MALDNNPVDLTAPGAAGDTKGDIDILASDSPEAQAELDKEEAEKVKATEAELGDDEPAKEEAAADDENLDEELEDTEDKPVVRRETYKKLEAEGVFKKHPELREVYFREQAFTNLFPTVEDAKEAATRVGYMDELANRMIGGSSRELLGALGSQSDDGRTKFVENFLPTLYESDPKLFLKATTPVVKNLLRHVMIEGLNTKNTNLEWSAKYISQLLYGSYEVPDEPAEDKSVSAERQKLQQERRELYTAKETEFRGEVIQNGETRLLREIETNLDPKEVLTPFMRQAVIKETMQKIGELMESDPQHLAVMRSLWKKAFASNYSAELKPRILSAYLGRARQLMPGIRSKVLSEAINGNNSRGRRDPVKKSIPSSGSMQGRNGNNSEAPKQANYYRKFSDMDIILGKDK